MHNLTPLPQLGAGRFPETGFLTISATRFGLPVRDVCSKHRFATPPDALILAASPHIDSATLAEVAMDLWGGAGSRDSKYVTQFRSKTLRIITKNIDP